ncbi:MAG: Sua5 family C-terminal domain-containing protein [Christensenellales bacterium]
MQALRRADGQGRARGDFGTGRAPLRRPHVPSVWAAKSTRRRRRRGCFAALRELDERGDTVALCEAVDTAGIGLAVMNRWGARRRLTSSRYDLSVF